MNAPFSRSSAVVAGLCVLAILGMAALCGVAIVGLHSSSEHAEAISTDEVVTTTVTAQFALDVDRAYADGQALALGASDPGVRADLFDEQIPAVEGRLADMLRIHEDDEADELRDIELLANQWADLRAVLNSSHLSGQGGRALATELRARYQEMRTHLRDLVDREATDAGARSDASSGTVSQTTSVLLVSSATVIALLVGLGLWGNRRIRRELEPAKDQVEFADTLQLAESEAEAHRLLQRRLVRVVPDSSVIVLNRNNSADRLEPMTDVPPESGLATRLEQAAPRACLAIRSARAHEEDPSRPGLLGCEVCQPCPGHSSCTPLTVSGEVIGSVLMNQPGRFQDLQRRQVREAVSQSAPVLANLRNLSIAQVRAATDALTGLPNKRAVADTLMRMFAQASRTASPLAVVSLDLDHFKDLNDRFGHPTGDQALASVGAAIRATLRDSDFAGRNGGEEFAVLLPNTDTEGARTTAEKLRKAIAQITVPGVAVELTASLGLAVYPEHGLTPERLERLADAALYVAKRSGRNRVEVATATTATLSGETELSGVAHESRLETPTSATNGLEATSRPT
jgi:diguanylate cyclase (GGDEF)-like protein